LQSKEEIFLEQLNLSNVINNDFLLSFIELPVSEEILSKKSPLLFSVE
jgi:hypothetical protein